MTGRKAYLAAALLAAAVTTGAVAADTPGVTATEIKIGNTVPYSGPASYMAYSESWKCILRHGERARWRCGSQDQFHFVGRQLQPAEDGRADPPPGRQEEVAFTLGTLGTPTNSAIVRYMNQKKVPHVFVSTGADKWGD